MRLEREWVEDLIFGHTMARRFTQDSPVLPDVWLSYAENLDEPLDLILTPYRTASPGELSRAIIERLGDSNHADIAYNQSSVAVRLTFAELVGIVLPLSEWWSQNILRSTRIAPLFTTSESYLKESQTLVRALSLSRPRGRNREPEGAMVGEGARDNELRELRISPDVVWMVRLVGTLLRAQGTEKLEYGTSEDRGHAWEALQEESELLVDAVLGLFQRQSEVVTKLQSLPRPLLWSVSRNRPAMAAVWRSVPAIKADAAFRLFDISCKDLTWAVLDSGIDATHWAFRKYDFKKPDKPPYQEPFESTDALDQNNNPLWRNNTRVTATYDFTRIRDLLRARDASAGGAGTTRELTAEQEAQISDLKGALMQGREVDWTVLAPLLQIPHDNNYQPPTHAHGTHVAGILAADWPPQQNDVTEGEVVRGVCPDINLYDMRVLDDQGTGDEFSIMAALQFLRHLNAHKDFVAIHGVNLSLSIRHDVANYACGRTPVCEECERLVAAGLVVVAAAGNEGYLQYTTSRGIQEGYRSVSITDPGNAGSVITVGATHRALPHTYGVSYFSSRGPTGDGRIKPDLVAPGEKIESVVPSNDMRRMDGTSMAAPHVSGAAALLMARHRELAGDPLRIKNILCSTATDLGRERYFQGSGMLDVLRALQSV